MWVYTLIGTILGTLGFFLGLWNLWRAHRQPIRDLQFERRKNYAKMLEIYAKQIGDVEEKAKRGIFPDQQTAENLGSATEMFKDVSNKLTVPTKPQSLRLDERLTAVTAAIDKYMVPTNDTEYFSDQVPEEVVVTLAALREDVEYTLAGLWKIEQGRTICYKRQFKNLGR